MHRLPKQAGFTLVELMVALTLGLIVIAALIGVFIANNQNYRQNEALAVVQDNARFALDVMSRDLAMAGYWGGVRATDAKLNVRVSAAGQAAVSNTSTTTGDCGPTGQSASSFWLFDVGTPLEFRSQTSGMPINSLFRCLDPNDLVANSDIVMIRHVAGQCAFTDDTAGCGTNTMVANRFYVKTNQNIASLFRATSTNFNSVRSSPADCVDGTGTSAPCPPVDTPQQAYAYTPQLYYVRNYLRTRGDDTPILCRRYLNDTAATPFMDEDCLAEGVENLQLEWGLGTGTVQRYVSNPTRAELLTALTVRLHVLVRSTGRNVQASNDAKTYSNLADLGATFTPTPATGVLRRLFTTTVQLKNLQ